MGKRYSLPHGKAYRPFNSGEVITNDNITDEIVEAILKTSPEAKKVFLDSENQGSPEQPTAGNGAEDFSKLTKKELHAKYVELTGKAADEKLNHAGLLALVNFEIEAAGALG
jgi:hypothetical protein